MRPIMLPFALVAATLALTATSRAAAPAAGVVTLVPSAGHQIAGFALDHEWLAVAEDPATGGNCPAVRLVDLSGGASQPLTRRNGPTCRLGGRFWVRPGGRALGLGIVRSIWVTRRGATSIVVKASLKDPEEVLARVGAIDPARGPFLGPVVATTWLRLYARYTRAAGGTLTGEVVSENRRTLWATTGPVLPLGLDEVEHTVTVGADGSIAMWHPHGARYGRVATARARAASVDRGVVAVLRSDRPRLDVRLLSGSRISSWPVAPGAAPLVDVENGFAVYFAGRAVHAISLSTGRDRVVAQAPHGTTLLDAQIERRFIAYAYRGGPAGTGRVVVVRR
jgi:hypothetical protein